MLFTVSPSLTIFSFNLQSRYSVLSKLFSIMQHLSASSDFSLSLSVYGNGILVSLKNLCKFFPFQLNISQKTCHNLRQSLQNSSISKDVPFLELLLIHERLVFAHKNFSICFHFLRPINAIKIWICCKKKLQFLMKLINVKRFYLSERYFTRFFFWGKILVKI